MNRENNKTIAIRRELEQLSKMYDELLQTCDSIPVALPKREKVNPRWTFLKIFRCKHNIGIVRQNFSVL